MDRQQLQTQDADCMQSAAANPTFKCAHLWCLVINQFRVQTWQKPLHFFSLLIMLPSISHAYMFTSRAALAPPAFRRSDGVQQRLFKLQLEPPARHAQNC